MATTYEYRSTSKDARIQAIRDAFDRGNWLRITPGQRRQIERLDDLDQRSRSKR